MWNFVELYLLQYEKTPPKMKYCSEETSEAAKYKRDTLTPTDEVLSQNKITEDFGFQNNLSFHRDWKLWSDSHFYMAVITFRTNQILFFLLTLSNNSSTLAPEI